MPNFQVRLNLASAIFPFYTQAAGRTIIVPENDENYDRYNAANTTPDKGVPQVFYMHNVLPIAGGYQSIGYTVSIPPYGAGTNTDFDQAFIIRGYSLSKVVYVPAAGANYIYDPNSGAWTSVSPLMPAGEVLGRIVTSAFINGLSYINYSNYGTYLYDPISKTIIQQVLLSLVDATVKGITAANGYMIAWTDDSIAWSSLINPLDFTPSIQTGSGGGQVQQIKGKINFCLPINGGFLIYCEENVVAASYTQNSSYPFIFSEIANSGGCYDPQCVGWQSNLDTHYAWTTAGMQGLNRSQAAAVMPELTDFLAAKTYEDFDDTARVFTRTYLSTPLKVKVTAIADRYIVISYSTDGITYTYAILWDLILGRYGKVKINHVSCFPYLNPLSTQVGITYAQALAAGTTYAADTQTYLQNGVSVVPVDTPKANVSFLAANGQVSVVVFDLSETTANGTFLIGKYQYKRNNFIVHQTTDVETIRPGNAFSMYLLPSLNGKNFQAAVPCGEINAETPEDQKTFALRYTAQNISLLFQGAFDLTSVIIQFTVGGFR